MQTTLALTALWMGVAGGPHCLAMCGAACAGIGHSAPAGGRALWSFHLGRLAGYAILGGLAAASVQALGWLSTQSAALRPLWTLLQAGTFVLGLVLAWSAHQPVWLDQAARRLWQRVRAGPAARFGAWAPAGMGMLWALMPCGLLYSALLVAALSSHPLQGAVNMLLFAAGSGVSLWAGPRMLSCLRQLGDGRWGIRMAGLALMATSGAALWLGRVHDQAPWCVSQVAGSAATQAASPR